jgi:cell wall-associated NlpC family hydrolase
VPPRIDGISLGAMAAGSVLLYAGVTGKSIPAALQLIISGKSPSAAPKKYGITQVVQEASGATEAADPGGSALLGGGLAAIAKSWVGKLIYHFGGPPPAGTVDCSSFASKCLNQAGVKNPGGQPYNPDAHGPSTISYLTWGGATTVGHSSSVAQVDDLLVYQTHMGICTGPDEMVSAQGPDGTSSVLPSSIDGMTQSLHEFLFVRRLK